MTEINEEKFEFVQDNKKYLLSISLISDKIRFACMDYSNSEIFDGEFTMKNLLDLSKYFQVTHNICQIKKYITNIIEKKKNGN